MPACWFARLATALQRDGSALRRRACDPRQFRVSPTLIRYAEDRRRSTGFRARRHQRPLQALRSPRREGGPALLSRRLHARLHQAVLLVRRSLRGGRPARRARRRDLRPIGRAPPPVPGDALGPGAAAGRHRPARGQGLRARAARRRHAARGGDRGRGRADRLPPRAPARDRLPDGRRPPRSSRCAAHPGLTRVQSRAVNTAVVTGAGRGMGRETARRLAQRGYQVLVTDLNEASANETAELIGNGAWASAQDVRDPESHRRVAAAASARGPLKVWVNNAGILKTEKVWDHSDDDVRLMVEVNLLATMWGARAALEAMRADPAGCHVINMASMASFGPVPGLGVYAATKHGVVGLTESLQGDLTLAGLPIRVHAVCPDLVDTGMMREHAGNPEYALGFSGTRIYTPEEIADEIVKLLDSDKIVLSIPRNRMAVARMAGLFPRTGLRLTRAFRGVGARKQKKFNAG